MINITAESKGNKTDLKIKINGTGEDIINEAVHIMQQLPKQMEQTSPSVFFRFLAKLAETDMFGICFEPKNNEEADDDAQ